MRIYSNRLILFFFVIRKDTDTFVIGRSLKNFLKSCLKKCISCYFCVSKIFFKFFFMFLLLPKFLSLKTFFYVRNCWVLRGTKSVLYHEWLKNFYPKLKRNTSRSIYGFKQKLSPRTYLADQQFPLLHLSTSLKEVRSRMIEPLIRVFYKHSAAPTPNEVFYL